MSSCVTASKSSNAIEYDPVLSNRLKMFAKCREYCSNERIFTIFSHLKSYLRLKLIFVLLVSLVIGKSKMKIQFVDD